MQNLRQSIVRCVGRMIGMDCLLPVRNRPVVLAALAGLAVVRQSSIGIDLTWDRFVKSAVRFGSAMAVAVIVVALVVVVVVGQIAVADSLHPVVLAACFQIDTMAGNFRLFSMVLRSPHDGIGRAVNRTWFFQPLALGTSSN